MKVDISKVRTDGGTQPRTEIDDTLVSEYAEAMRGGDQFPPITVFWDGVEYWLADGFHRLHAARRAGFSELDVDKRDGTRRDAILHSVGANAAHGRRRTPADKRKAVETLLTNPDVANDPKTGHPWSDNQIAKLCRVSHPFVGKVRSEVTCNVTSMDQERRAFTHHKTGKPTTMNTTNIGKRKPDEAPPEAEDSSPDGGEQEQAPERPQSRGVGIRLAHEAIAVLKRIPYNDGLRDEAFDTVTNWIEANRSRA